MVDLFSRPAAILAAVLLFAAGVMPGTAQALGLGELSVESGPGEPLRLVIEVHSVSASEAETLDVSLAGRSDFAAAGLEYPSLADAMEFALVPLDQGGYQVVITTLEAVDDASLGLLVAATWAGGREVREYTASLAAAPSATSVSVGSVEEEGESTEDAAVEDARPVAIPGEEFVVESGHTLSHIVLWMNVPEDLHRFRAYLSVFRNNPRAFINENMNLIRSGAVLRLPTFDEIRTVTYSESVAAYSEQLDQFTAYQQRVRQRRADPDPAPEPQIADTVTEPEAAEPEAAPTAVTEEEPPVVEEPEAEVAAEPAPEPAVEDAPEVTEEIAPEEPVQVDVTEPGQVTEPVETPPEIPEVEVAEEPAPAVEEPAGPQLTISQEADPEAVPAEDDAQALLKALESELAQMDETLLASGEETRNVQENLQQMQEQTGDISTLLEVENVPLATAQSRAAGEQEEDPDLPESVQADDGTTETPALESAEPQVSGVADDDGAVETVEVSEDQVAAPEEPVEVSTADAEAGAVTETDEILLAQQDTAPAEDEVPAVTGDAAVPEPAEPEEEIQLAMVEPGTQPETADTMEEAPAVEVAAEADDGTAELPALDAAGALASGVAGGDGVAGIVKIPEDQDAQEEPAEVSAADAEPGAAAETDEILLAQQDTVPAEDEVPAVTGDAAAPAPEEPEEELQVAMAEPGTQPESAEAMEEAPAGEVAAKVDDGTAELPALESTEPMVSGVAEDDGVVETVKIPEDQAPAEDEPLAETMDPAVPEPTEPEEAPAVEMAAEADDGTVELPSLDSAEPLVSGVAGDDGVVEIVKIPEDQDAPEEPAEVTAADAEPATGSEEILLAQQETAPAEEETMTVTVDPVVPALEEPEEAEEAPAGEVAVQADEGTTEAPAGESTEPMVSGVADDDGVVETVKAPEDEAAPEEPAEVAEADAEPEAAAETYEILLAQQDTTPTEEETPAVTVDPAVPAQEEPEEETAEESQVAVTVSGTQPEPADAPEEEPVSAVATDDGYGEPAPAASPDGLLDWIKNVFAILPDYGPKIAVGLLALLAALFVWQRRKARRMSEDGDADSSDRESPPESGAPARPMQDAGSDPAQDTAPQESADAGLADEGAEGAAASAEVTGEGGPSGEIDPVVEADVYLEYDRIEQAIEVLKDAWTVDPERGELAEKLLEIYHMQDDRWAFDSLAEELRARGGLSRNVNWDRIIAMGKEVSPNNPLFTGEVPLHEEPAAGPEEADGDSADSGDSGDAPDGAAGPQEDSGPDDAGEEESREDNVREPDSDEEAPKPGDGGDGSVQAAAGESGAGEPPDEEPGGESPDSEETEETEDESETALELARAYMDLGEREIARGYLEEVFKGGNEDQKKRAQDFIRELDD